MTWLILAALSAAATQDEARVADWIRLLEDDDPQVRQSAATALGKRWGDESLRDTITDLRDRAARTGNLDLRALAGRILRDLAAFDQFAGALRARVGALREKAGAVPFAEEPLRRIAADANRLPHERAAAMALLGAAATEARLREISNAFRELDERVSRMQVIRFDMYARDIEARLNDGRIKVSGEDIPMLANMGLLQDEALALLCLAHAADPRAFDILLAAGPTRLGEGGDPVLFGLERFAASDVRYRDALAAELDRGEARSLEWMRALAALSAAGDDRVAAPTAGLLRDLAEGRLREVPILSTSRLLSLIVRRPRAEYAPLLEAWIRRGGVPWSTLAGAHEACGGSLEKRDLWPLLDADAPSADAAAVVKRLLPLLDMGDGGRLADMLAPARWKTKSFHVRFDLLDGCEGKLLTRQVTAALWRIVDECGHGYFRARAIQCASRAGDPADHPRLLRLVGEPGDVGLQALRVLLRRGEHPLDLVREMLGSQDAARSRTAMALFEAHFLSGGECPIPKTDENWTRVGARLLERIDAADGPASLVEAVQALYYVLAGTPRARFADDAKRDAADRLRRAAERHPSDAIRGLLQNCLARLD
jgi:hypothetical protein